MFTIGFRGCDFHEKDACGSAGSASLTGSGLSAGSSQAVPLLNATFWTLWKATIVPGTRRVAWYAKRGFLTSGACGHLYLFFRRGA